MYADFRRLSFLGRISLVVLVMLAAVVGVAVKEANALITATSQITVSPTTQTHATGSPFSYTIAVSCAGTAGTACGPNVTVVVPLTTATTPPMTDPSWRYAATSATAGFLTSGPEIIGNNLVVGLSSVDFIAGYSGTIKLTVTPPNLVTPNNTVWALRPTIDGNGILPTKAPTAAVSQATAAPLVSLSKATADGGSVYEVGSPITFKLTAKCSSATSGNLELEHGELVDYLPAELTYVSSTPTGATYDSVQHSVTWTFPKSDPSALPQGCHPLGGGTNTYTVTTTAPSAVPALQPIRNTATFDGTGADAHNAEGITSSTSAQVPINMVLVPGTGPGLGYAAVTKSSLAPIPQGGIVTGNQYVGTYPGQWVTPSATPTFTIGAAAASYRTTVAYALVGHYQTTIVDPVPCLTSVVGNVFNSLTPSAAACSDPAFLTTIFQVTSAGFDPTVNGLGHAYANGWRPSVLYADGSSASLNATSSVSATASSAFFAIPAGKSVATVTVPPHLLLQNRTLQLAMWGYASAELSNLNASLNELHNTAVATPQLSTGGPLTPVSASNSVFTLPNVIQLGISKAFGTLGAAARGTTEMTVVGSINNPNTNLSHDVVVSDLLPLGLSWSNPVGSVKVTATRAGQSATVVQANVEYLTNYAGTKRSLIRITVPKVTISSPGAWTLAFPSGFLLLTTPSALGLYPNTDQIFLKGLGAAPINEVCSTPTQSGGGISTATYQSDNSGDLSGDGYSSEAHCQNSATLSVTGTGAAFSLTKSTQGDLDPLAKGALGVGETGEGGSGVFVLNWSNVGSDTLQHAVIYDLLPTPGDQGVSQGQSAVPRDSATNVVFEATSTGADVEVAYSTATNPCRPEVFANAQNSTCLDDWSTTPPPALSLVTALRFTGAGPYPKGSSFSAAITVKMPSDVINHIAWNSAATNASDLSNPSTVTLPAEPPKVGLVVPSTPTLQTVTSASEVGQFDSISDQVTISGTGGAPGTLEWSLIGPAEVVGNACDDADYSTAPTAASGSVPVAGNGTLTIGPAATTTGGCYSWGYHLVGESYPDSADQAPGAPGENTLVTPYPPRIVTTASQTFSTDGSVSLSDSIQVDSISLGNPSPPTPLSWTLSGPRTAAGGTCSDLDWTTAATVASGSIALVAGGNGTYATPPTQVSAPGCYSFETSLPASAGSLGVTKPLGLERETINVVAPTIVTVSSQVSALPWTAVRDEVTITGTHGGSGDLHWQLQGPVSTSSGSCAGVDWSSAPVLDRGTVAISGDQSTTTGPATLHGPGCYSWSDTLTSSTSPGFPSPAIHVAGSANEVITVTPTTPTMTTKAAHKSQHGATTLSDAITISGLGSEESGPVHATYEWDLVGPVATTNLSCNNLTWTGAATVASGTVDLIGDGTTTTREVPITNSGCYSFREHLRPTKNSAGVRTQLGEPLETFFLAASPLQPLPSTGFNAGAMVLLALLSGGVGLVLIAISRRLRSE